MTTPSPGQVPAFSTVVRLPRQWFIAATTRALGKRPLRTRLQGLPVVLFRGSEGKAAALLDRCPHRNVPLSAGRVIGDGTLQCSYHGWCFDSAGACRAIPGQEGETDTPARRVPSFEARELDGFVWLWAKPDEVPTGEPFRFPHLGTPGYTHVRRSFEVESTLHAMIENTLDVPHTAFLHGGLFRNPGGAPPLEVVVRSGPISVSAEYLGEPVPGGVLGRLLAPKGGVVEHVDRFLLPSIVQVEYRLGRSHLVTTSALTPLEDFRTAVHTLGSFRLPVPGSLVRPFVTPIAEHIFKQDAAMLKLQTNTLRDFGAEHFVSTGLDAIGPAALKLLRKAAAGPVDDEGPVLERRFTLRL